MRPLEKSLITASFSFHFIFPCISPTVSPFKSFSLNLSASDIAASASTTSDSSTRGHMMYTCLPSFTFFLINRFILSRIDSSTAYVFTGLRFGGSSSMIEISRSPYNISARVRGMGVAVMTRISGFDFADSTALCLTPNLCCSSVTTRPSFKKTTSSSRSACVPIIKLYSPFFMPSFICSFFFLLTLPVISAVLTP